MEINSMFGFPIVQFLEEFYALAVSKNGVHDRNAYNPIADLIETIRLFCGHEMARDVERNFNKKQGKEFVKNVVKANMQLKGQRLRLRDPAHILHQTYCRTAALKISNLRRYKAFSNEVYGEINLPFVKEIIRETGLNKNNVFVDLGSGIGNVVLQVAADVKCESHGIEINPPYAKIARLQYIEFKSRAKHFGLKHGKVALSCGDFLKADHVSSLLARADVVFVNNYVFSADTNYGLSQLFLECKEGALIVSLKPFTGDINERNKGSVEGIMRVESRNYGTGMVSWTAKAGEYFIHTIDRKRLQEMWNE